MHVINANSAHPDETPCSAASDLGLHCLPMSHLWDGLSQTNRIIHRRDFFKDVLAFFSLLRLLCLIWRIDIAIMCYHGLGTFTIILLIELMQFISTILPSFVSRLECLTDYTFRGLDTLD